MRDDNSHNLYLRDVVDLFLNDGWKVDLEPAFGRYRPDLVIKKGPFQYIVEFKRAPEGRRDRIIPLLAQAALQAQSYASHMPAAKPLAIVHCPELKESVGRQIMPFVHDFIPGVAIGIIDELGWQMFHGAGLENLNSGPGQRHVQRSPQYRKSSGLFSDLNQWMLKVLLAGRISPQQIHAPREPIYNSSDLASKAQVSMMSASRLVRQLEREGYLSQSAPLELVRLPELFEEWQSAVRRSYEEVPCRWILPGLSQQRLNQSLRGLDNSDSNDVRKARSRSPRVCLALYAAADALGLRFVSGADMHLYVEKFDQHLLRYLGVAEQLDELRPDLFIRIPSNKECIFRAAVNIKGALVADVVQVYLDIYSHPSRGREQAEMLRQKVLRFLIH